MKELQLTKSSQIEGKTSMISSYLDMMFKKEGKRDIHDSKWQLFLASKFSLEDSQSAIDKYSDSYYDSPNYLLYYGLLQALNNQQDAINAMFGVIYSREVPRNVLKVYPKFEKIRTIRNMVLHSVENTFTDGSKNKVIRYYRVDQSSMRKYSFEIVEYTRIANSFKKGVAVDISEKLCFPKFMEVNLGELIDLQEKIVFEELDRFIDDLKECKTFQELEQKCPIQI